MGWPAQRPSARMGGGRASRVIRLRSQSVSLPTSHRGSTLKQWTRPVGCRPYWGMAAGFFVIKAPGFARQIVLVYLKQEDFYKKGLY